VEHTQYTILKAIFHVNLDSYYPVIMSSYPITHPT